MLCKIVHTAFFVVIITAPEQQTIELVSQLSMECMRHMLIRTSVRPCDAAAVLSSRGSYLSGASNHVDQLDQMSQCLAVGLPRGRP